MLHVAIVEDHKTERENIKRNLLAMQDDLNVKFEIDEFESGLAFLGSYKPIYNLVLMDIDMPGSTGMEIAHKLRVIDKSVGILFITNLAQYAIEGYEVDAIDFIVKPINPFNFFMRMQRAVSRAVKVLDDSIQIRCEGEIFRVQVDGIQYVESDGHYVIFHTVEGTFREYATIKEVEETLSRSYFARCNRCYLVNLKYVTVFKQNSVVVAGSELQVSRNQKKAFLNAYSLFLGGNV